MSFGLTAIQLAATSIINSAKEAFSGEENHEKASAYPQQETKTSLLGNDSLLAEASSFLNSVHSNNARQKGLVGFFSLSQKIEDNKIDISSLNEEQCDDAKTLVTKIVESAVEETVHLFNLPIKQRMPDGSPYFWRYKPLKKVEKAKDLLRAYHSLFTPEELHLLRFNLKRAEALLAPGLAQGSDKAIAKLKALKKPLTPEQQQDPRYQNILDHVELHLRKIYDRRRMLDQYENEKFVESFSQWFDPEFRQKILDRIETEWQAQKEFYQENPEIWEATQFRRAYKATIAQVESRAVEYINTRYRLAKEPTLIEGWLDFSELPDGLKTWKQNTQSEVNQTLDLLSKQVNNPELEDEIITMQANLQLAQSIFEDRPFAALKEFRDQLSNQANGHIGSNYDEPLRRTDQLIWRVLSTNNISYKAGKGKNLTQLLTERGKQDSFPDIQANNYAKDDWDQEAIALLGQCLQDDLCSTEGVRHLYRQTIESLQDWVSVPDRREHPEFLKQKPWSKILETRDMLTAHVLNPYLENEQPFMQLNLDRLEMILTAHSHNTLEKLANLRENIEKSQFPGEIGELFSGQISVDIMREKLEAVTTPEWKVSLLSAEVLLREEKYDMEKVYQILEETAHIAENSSYEKAARIYLGIAEYCMFKMKSVDVLRGNGLQALIKLLREYPDSEAARVARHNPLLHPLVKRILVDDKVPEYLHASDLTDDNWREAFKVLTEHGMRHSGARKASWVTISAVALLASAAIYKRANLKQMISLGAATEEVTMSIAFGLVLAGVGLDSIIPALNHSSEAAKAQVLPIYRIGEQRHAENMDILFRTAMYFPAFLSARATIENSRLLYSLVGNSMKTRRAQLMLTGLALPYHTEASNGISSLISGSRYAVHRDYSASNILGLAASSFLPLAIKDGINKNPTLARILFIDAKNKSVQEIHAFGYAGAVINLAWLGANHVYQENGGQGEVEYPYPVSASGFWAMEARDMTWQKSNFHLRDEGFWANPLRIHPPTSAVYEARHSRAIWRGLRIR
ncbi:MAG: hypothetical protein H7A32_02230 [Deltaproteobacteria bacterium]|nr:hypothetical protein [Deltaproteobacteria bacterium]